MAKPRGQMTPEELARARAKDRERYEREKEDAVREADRIVKLTQFPDVTVADAPESPSPSLKERLLSKMSGLHDQAASLPKAKRTAGKKDNLINTVLPTVLSAFIATYSAQLVGYPYSACCPSQEECSAILTPLLSIVARRVELSGKASQDAIDGCNAAIAAIVCGTRSYITYTTIREAEKQRGDNQDETPRTSRHRTNHDDARQGRSIDTGDRLPVDQEVATEHASPDAQAVAELFRRDKQGRAQLGLLPG